MLALSLAVLAFAFGVGVGMYLACYLITHRAVAYGAVDEMRALLRKTRGHV